MRRFAIITLGLSLTLTLSAYFSHPAQAITMSPVRTELSADPGQTIAGKFLIINDDRDTKLLYLVVQNFTAKDETGIPLFSPKKENFATWINLPKTITLGPREQKTVEYSVSVPRDADPGGYFSSIFASSLPPAEENNGSIGLGSDVGTLALLRVNGPITESTSILEFKTKDGSLFSSLPVDMYFRFQNSGESWVKPIGDVIVKNTFGGTSKIIRANPDGSNVLPKSIRRFDVAWLTSPGAELQDKDAQRPPTAPEGFWNKVKHEWRYFGLGRYTANLTLTYNNDTSTTQQAHLAFWIIPWHFLAVAVPAIIVLLILLYLFIKYYNRSIVRRAQRR